MCRSRPLEELEISVEAGWFNGSPKSPPEGKYPQTCYYTVIIRERQAARRAGMIFEFWAFRTSHIARHRFLFPSFRHVIVQFFSSTELCVDLDSPRGRSPDPIIVQEAGGLGPWGPGRRGGQCEVEAKRRRKNLKGMQ